MLRDVKYGHGSTGTLLRGNLVRKDKKRALNILNTTKESSIPYFVCDSLEHIIFSLFIEKLNLRNRRISPWKISPQQKHCRQTLYNVGICT